MTIQTRDLAFWGRVVTEDNQDPESSCGWQLTPRGHPVAYEQPSDRPETARSCAWPRAAGRTLLLAVRHGRILKAADELRGGSSASRDVIACLMRAPART